MVLLLLVAWVAYLVVVPFLAWNKVEKAAWEPDGERPADQPGTTYLLVGSDSRADLTKAQRQELSTGTVEGQRTDTIMLLHTGSGPNLLMSIPRDSLVDIPGSGVGKINGAFARGGAPLLVQTLEQDTGIRIDDYAEIGLGGVVDMVDAVGGIQICPNHRMRDKLAGLNIKKGCQDVDGATALAYSRSRHTNLKLGDVARARQQREVVKAVGKKALSPWTFVNPVRYWSLNMAVPASFSFGDGTSKITAGRFGLAMTRVNGSNGLTCSVPISDLSVRWDEERSQQMFAKIISDDTDSIGGPVHPLRLPQESDLVTDLTSAPPTAAPTAAPTVLETISYDVDADGVCTLTLDRPDALNSFTVTMARELETFFLETAHDDAIRAVVVTGAGRAFCAGMDLSATGNVFGLDESVRPTPEDLREHLTEAPYHDGIRDTGGRVTLAIHALPKPVIAAINGPAVGIGATMTLAMDIRMASTKARIGFVFGRLGIVPEACSSWFLPRIVGIQRPWSGSTPPTSSPPRTRSPGACCARCTSPTTWSPRRRTSPARSSSTGPRPRSAWPSSCSTATAPPSTRSRHTSPTRWRCSGPRSPTARRASRRSSRSAPRSSPAVPPTSPGSSRPDPPAGGRERRVSAGR